MNDLGEAHFILFLQGQRSMLICESRVNLDHFHLFEKRSETIGFGGKVMYSKCISCHNHGNPMGRAIVREGRVKSKPDHGHNPPCKPFTRAEVEVFNRDKARDSYVILVPKAPFSTKSPNDFDGNLSLRSAFTYRRKHCRLRKGSLSIFNDRNKTRLRHLIHLGITSSIAYSTARNRIVINTDEEIYRFKVRDSAGLNEWLDNLTKHKAFALAISLKAEEVEERKSRRLTAKKDKQAEKMTTDTSSSAPDKNLSVVVHSEESASKDITYFADQLNLVRKEGIAVLSNLEANVHNSSEKVIDKEARTKIKSYSILAKELDSLHEQMLDIITKRLDEDSKWLVLNRVLQTPPIVIPISSTSRTLSPMTKSTDEESAQKKTVARKPKSPLEKDEKSTSSESSEREKFLSKGSLVPAKSARLDPMISVKALTEAVKRRSSLPQPMGPGNVSLWSVFGQMLGKDMGKVSLPVDMMEPLSVLQVVCEELEYSNLLDKAASESDLFKRMKEKLLNMFDMTSVGGFSVNRQKETYRWRKVKTMIGNVFSEKKSVDHVGDLTIWSSNRASCKIHFKQGCREVTGNIFDRHNKPVHRLTGNWAKSLSMWTDKREFTLWEVSRLPPNHEKYYGFTYFALSLNEITEDIKDHLPPTDSRFRTDKRFLENGKLNEARQEKHRLEEAQRARRKMRKYQPKWFDKELTAKDAHQVNYKFTGRYWDARRKNFVKETFDQLW